MDKYDQIGAKIAEQARVKDKSENLWMFLRHEPETAYITLIAGREIVGIGYNTDEFRNSISRWLSHKIKSNKTIRKPSNSVYVEVYRL